MVSHKILLCGKRCTGKTTLFWDLQKTLSWPTFTISQYLRDYIHRFHLSPEEMEAQSEQLSHDIDERVMKLLSGPDHVVIDARVFGYIDRSFPDTCKVLLTAHDDVRIARAAYREKTSVDKQHARLLNRENAWLERIKQTYKRDDLFDPKWYDLVIDTGPLSSEQILSIVLA